MGKFRAVRQKASSERDIINGGHYETKEDYYIDWNNHKLGLRFGCGRGQSMRGMPAGQIHEWYDHKGVYRLPRELLLSGWHERRAMPVRQHYRRSDEKYGKGGLQDCLCVGAVL